MNMQKEIEIAVYSENDDILKQNTDTLQNCIVDTLQLFNVRENLNQYLSLFAQMAVYGTECVENISVLRAIHNVRYLLDVLAVKKDDEPIVRGFSWDELPDILTDDDMKRISGWTSTTLASKRSRRDIPYVEKPFIGYPKDKIKAFFEQNVKLPLSMREEEYDDKIDTSIRKKKR